MTSSRGGFVNFLGRGGDFLRVFAWSRDRSARFFAKIARSKLKPSRRLSRPAANDAADLGHLVAGQFAIGRVPRRPASEADKSNGNRRFGYRFRWWDDSDGEILPSAESTFSSMVPGRDKTDFYRFACRPVEPLTFDLWAFLIIAWACFDPIPSFQVYVRGSKPGRRPPRSTKRTGKVTDAAKTDTFEDGHRSIFSSLVLHGNTWRFAFPRLPAGWTTEVSRVWALASGDEADHFDWSDEFL